MQPNYKIMDDNNKYIVYAVGEDGTRNKIDAESIIITINDEEIEIPLSAPHPVFQGKLTLVTGSTVKGREDERGIGVHFVIEPGASNVIHVTPKKNG
ncbi:hypothetical protein IQ37_11165 [Chryseobacterium piperi]|uniref:Uncharacterized protein n=3 Tax=Chryseobacterium piperi TaxID=558152 RepID=A0A086BCR7_9FLAO|nr:hypothetical protein CJF12_03900 [Chryseobacterium piperi]KFF26731.1 hypothetical protein IQ37_11165 [Chryseobacterium piperi]